MLACDSQCSLRCFLCFFRQGVDGSEHDQQSDRQRTSRDTIMLFIETFQRSQDDVSPTLSLPSHQTTIQEWCILTNLNPRPITNIRKALHRTLRIVPTELRNRRSHILLSTHGLHIAGIAVQVDGAEKAARGRRGDQGREREEGCCEEGAGEHIRNWLVGWLERGVEW